jgi:signal transduction histidine kinase
MSIRPNVVWLLSVRRQHEFARKRGCISIELSTAASGRSVLITDNGVGFDMGNAANQSGFGLFSMRQRAASIGAELELASQVGQGTQVLISLSTTSSPR